jgi:hypothetical protein
MLQSLLFLAGLAPLAVEPCNSVARCNSQGTSAYQAGRYAQALEHFERQIDYAETAIQDREIEDQPVEPKLSQARETALNNALLALIKAGECLKARAYLSLTDASASATRANTRVFEQRCADAMQQSGPVGDYWQYAGHGAWNRATIRQRPDGSLELDAFFMRISRGPLDTYGPAAFGSHAGVALRIDQPSTPGGQTSAEGDYEGYGEDPQCTLRLHFTEAGFEVADQTNTDCHIGGAGAWFVGPYLYVSSTASAPDESVQ